MMKEPIITVEGNCIVGEYEPGNGTCYTAIAVPWQSEKVMGVVGMVSNGWLVISGNTGRAHLLQKDGYLVDRYIKEHFGGLAEDYPYIGDLMRALIKRPGGRRIGFDYNPPVEQPHDDMPDDREAYYNERAEKEALPEPPENKGE